MSAEITTGDLELLQQDLTATPGAHALTKADLKHGINDTAENTDRQVAMTHTLDFELDTGAVYNTKTSGRCWMFAALNKLRLGILATFKIQDFELSTKDSFFWEQFEKTQVFYENVLKTADTPLDSRKVAFLLESPTTDGGTWDMLTALIEKYGIVPKTVMPETDC